MPDTEKRLISFVQVSDPHFGELDQTTGDSALSAKAPTWWGRLPWFEGFLGHHREALEHFEDAYRLLKKENAGLIVTGDLTATGNQNEFFLARTYFTGRVTLGPYRTFGLDNAVGLDLAIPGNHDHWPGTRRIFGGPTPGLSQMFRQLPYINSPLPIGPGCQLVFIGIDSDADVITRGSRRLFARGDFCSQLNLLRGFLGAPNPQEVRVLLLHHSPMYRSQSWFRQLEIEPKSQKELEDFVRDRDIAVMLTGHAHIACGNVHPVSDGRGSHWELLEARCGSTTARDTVPKAWAAAGVSQQLPSNTFLLHRLVLVNDEATGARIEWRTRLFSRTLRGFRDVGILPGSRAVSVWPRP